MDLKDGAIAIKGWKETAPERAEDFFTRLCGLGVKTVICTDISKDGMLGAPMWSSIRPSPSSFPWTSSPRGRVKCFRLTEAEGPWLIRSDFGQSPVHRGSGFENGFEGGGVRW